MPTTKEIFRHVHNMHDVQSNDLLRELYRADGDIGVVHDDLHTGEVGHVHSADGTIESETKTVLGDKEITRTQNGWSYSSTAAEALTEFNSIMNNRTVLSQFENTGEKILGKIVFGSTRLSVEADTFLDVIRLLLGESYNHISERNGE